MSLFLEYVYEGVDGEVVQIPLRVFASTRQELALKLKAFWVTYDGVDYPVHKLKLVEKGDNQKVGIPLASGVSGFIAGDITNNGAIGFATSMGVGLGANAKYQNDIEMMNDFNASTGALISAFKRLEKWRLSMNLDIDGMVSFLSEEFGPIDKKDYVTWEAGVVPVPSIIVLFIPEA